MSRITSRAQPEKGDYAVPAPWPAHCCAARPERCSRGPLRSSSHAVSNADDGRARVLVADDSFEMAQSVAEGLCDRGYDAIAVGSGYEALDLLAGSSFDALITDLRMPGIDGLALMARSRPSIRFARSSR